MSNTAKLLERPGLAVTYAIRDHRGALIGHYLHPEVGVRALNKSPTGIDLIRIPDGVIIATHDITHLNLDAPIPYWPIDVVEDVQ